MSFVFFIYVVAAIWWGGCFWGMLASKDEQTSAGFQAGMGIAVAIMVAIEFFGYGVFFTPAGDIFVNY